MGKFRGSAKNSVFRGKLWSLPNNNLSYCMQQYRYGRLKII